MTDITQQTCPKNGQHFTTSGTSARNSVAVSGELVTIHASQDCYIKIGDSAVVAAANDYDMHVVANQYFYLRMNGKTHIAAIQVSSSGTFYINEEK